LIPAGDLETLKSFESDGHLVLSVYLRLDTAQGRESAYADFVDRVQTELAECNAEPECREALKEDVEIVGMYLKANGHRRHAGLAIFSCAARYFWRAYPLSTPLPIRITAGSKFDVKPLLQAIEQPTA